MSKANEGRALPLYHVGGDALACSCIALYPHMAADITRTKPFAINRFAPTGWAAVLCTCRIVHR